MDRKLLPRRKYHRKHGHDYTQGAYFITICTHDRAYLFGDIRAGVMRCNAYGLLAASYWKSISHHYPHTTRDEYVIMPNHMHGILFLDDGNRTPLGRIIGNYKGAVTREINRNRSESAIEIIWQRNYHDVVIEDEMMLGNMRGYIRTNPSRWEADRFFDK